MSPLKIANKYLAYRERCIIQGVQPLPYKQFAKGLQGNVMTEAELQQRIKKILALSDDLESAHAEEDILHEDVIKAFCPKWVVREIDNLSQVEFDRWCA